MTLGSETVGPDLCWDLPTKSQAHPDPRLTELYLLLAGAVRNLQSCPDISIL